MKKIILLLFTLLAPQLILQAQSCTRNSEMECTGSK